MMLERINRVNDIQKLSESELPVLADEIRKEIIRVVYQNGGHLGSNLGVVELTLALHYVFDVRRDIIVWDGSYQTYTHKILTGRRERFDTLRQMGGLCGFQWKSESEFDPFNFGHVGTALAAAYGCAVADEKTGRKRKVIAVVGDGSMTCGVAFEALNNIGASKKDILVILNDNGFSIAPTVGAWSRYLNELRTAPLYDEVKRELHRIFEKVPLGRTIEKTLEGIRRGLKQALFPNIFTAFGFQYYGPVDGHDIKELLKILNNLRQQKGPVLLHVITQKGQGHPDCTKDAFGLHKPAEPRLPQKLEPHGQKPPIQSRSYTRAFVDILSSLAERDRRLVAITAAMPDGTGLLEIARNFPDRVFDVGISEQCAVAFAAGLAQSGLRPVVAIYATFLQRAFDMIFQELCLNDLPVVLAMDRAGIAGEDGPTHHGLFDIAFLRSFPNISLMAPKDEAEFRTMMELALASPHPVAIRYPRENVPDLGFGPTPVELGKGEVLVEGKHGMLLAYGAMVLRALQAREQLLAEGINVGVANARFAKPIDQELVADLTGRYPWVLTLEDHSVHGGFGSAVLEAAAMRGADARKVRILGAPDKFIEHASREQLFELLGLNAQGIARVCRRLVENPKLANEHLIVNELAYTPKANTSDSRFLPF